MSDPIVGIDLGTSNSVVAYADTTGNAKVLADDAGGKVHPSVVSFHPNGGVIAGAAAKQRKVIDPQNTIYSIKRLIGRSYRSPEVQTAKTRAPFQIKEGPNAAPLIVTRAGEFAVPEISAIVLDHVRNIAAARLGTPIRRAVVTVPASFNDAQRSATATAGAIAGLTVVRVLNEPTAAALAYGHSRHLRDIIAVYDFGGGTFDITLLRLDDQVYEVLGTSGDTFLGGDDLDERLVDKMVAKFLAENRLDLRTNEVSMMRLRAVAEQTKIELSRRARAVVRIDEIAYGPRGVPLNLTIEISRDEFVREVSDLIDRTFPVCTEALALANLSLDRIADVILVGGTTKIPYVRDQVARFFARAPRSDVNPEDAVAAGAALQATALDRILARRPSSRVAGPAQHEATTAAEEETTTSFTDALELVDPESGPESDAESGPESGATTATSELTELELDSGAFPPPVRPITSTGMASPPPLPRPGVRQGSPVRGPAPSFRATAPVPSMQQAPEPSRPPPPPPVAAPRPIGGPSGPASGSPHASHGPDWMAADSGAATRPEAWAVRNPATTQPLAPTAPLAPPTAPTLVAIMADHTAASTARGIGAQTIAAEPSPAVTARGFQPPARYPMQPAVQPVFVAAPAPAPVPAPAPPSHPPPVLLEVTPRGLGIATVAGYCEALIRRNARVPAETRKLFTTSRDQQDLVRIVVCQGESRRLDNNTVIGDLVLQNLPPRPRGETSIEVIFSLDASGVLNVRARDAQTGAEQRATLALVGGVAQEEVSASRDRIKQLRR